MFVYAIIPVKQDLPVGKNLQDHLGTFVGPFVIEDKRTLLIDRDITKRAFLKFGIHGKGVLTTTGHHASAYISSPQVKKAGWGNWPNIQITLAGLAAHKTFPKDAAAAFNVVADGAAQYYNSSIGKDSFFLIPSIGRPKGRGEITLADSNPKSHPVISPKYLENDEDFLTLLQGVKKSIWIAETSQAFSFIGSKLTGTVFPGCDSVTHRSEAYWECYVRSLSVSLNHYVGTCSMGKRGTPGAVVDTDLRVIGTKGLRVMDASIIPFIPVGGTAAAVIMIGEKGADLIKSAWVPGFDTNPHYMHDYGAHELKETVGDDDLEPFRPMFEFPKTTAATPLEVPKGAYGTPDHTPGEPVGGYDPQNTNSGSDPSVQILPPEEYSSDRLPLSSWRTYSNMTEEDMEVMSFMESFRSANDIFGVPDNRDLSLPKMMKKINNVLDILETPEMQRMALPEVQSKARSALDIFSIPQLENMTVPEMMETLKSANDIFGDPEDKNMTTMEITSKLKSANEIFAIPDIEKMTVEEMKEKTKSALDIFGVSPVTMTVPEAMSKLKSANNIFGIVDPEPDTNVTVRQMMRSLKSASQIFGVPSDLSVVLNKNLPGRKRNRFSGQNFTTPDVFEVVERIKSNRALKLGNERKSKNMTALNFIDMLGTMEPLQPIHGNEDEEALAIEKEVADLMRQFGSIPEFKPLPIDDSNSSSLLQPNQVVTSSAEKPLPVESAATVNLDFNFPEKINATTMMQSLIQFMKSPAFRLRFGDRILPKVKYLLTAKFALANSNVTNATIQSQTTVASSKTVTKVTTSTTQTESTTTPRADVNKAPTEVTSIPESEPIQLELKPVQQESIPVQQESAPLQQESEPGQIEPITVETGSRIVAKPVKVFEKPPLKPAPKPSKADPEDLPELKPDEADDEDDVRDQRLEGLLNTGGLATLGGIFDRLRPALSILSAGENAANALGINNLNFFEDFDLPGVKTVRSMLGLFGRGGEEDLEDKWVKILRHPDFVSTVVTLG
ncbi:unnamed protein product [Allacma fusca]|uniref:Glucose-methanol-choline oxidoreductase C-terminal domain-containing protein n=1 Tax=Allacma fusca TaxID=39272 RepID=A0A8J2J4Q2_9HEXA|nr:unnamed protein product [Allacma fusca]